MSKEREKRVWPWIVALLLAPVLYVASLGPACWWASQELVEVKSGSQTWVLRRAPLAYLPIGSLIARSPRSFERALNWYVSLGLDAETGVRLATTFDESR